jgi:NAD(P)-dependent dehydrogenase (short-subunit alcohol dehydrogenase family)
MRALNGGPGRTRDLAGRRVLLTGATGGLGPEMAAALHDAGTTLVLSALPGPELEALARRLDSRALPVDLRDPAAPARLAELATATLGGVDVLVHNAGVERVGRFTDQTAWALEEVVRVNLLAAMDLSRRLLPAMEARRWGRLVFISSLAGKTGPACTGAYAASKAGLVALARTLRCEYEGTGVTASVVVPGFVRGAGMYGRGEAKSGVGASWLMGTVTSEAVARAVLRAVRGDDPELMVQRGPTRLALAAAELFPGLVGKRLNRWVGSDRFFRRWAEARGAVDDERPS